jgi:hypothetical protein
MIKRRQFIVGLGGAAAWSAVARAQQPSMPVIGVLGFTFPNKNFTVPFLQGLKETGYVEGQNVAIEQRWAENQPRWLQTASMKSSCCRLTLKKVMILARSTRVVSKSPEAGKSKSTR